MRTSRMCINILKLYSLNRYFVDRFIPCFDSIWVYFFVSSFVYVQCARILFGGGNHSFFRNERDFDNTADRERTRRE